MAVNLRFSSNTAKYGKPPRTVRLGGRLTVVFDDPRALVAKGVEVDPKVAKALVDNVPGFKKPQKLGARRKRVPR